MEGCIWYVPGVKLIFFCVHNIVIIKLFWFAYLHVVSDDSHFTFVSIYDNSKQSEIYQALSGLDSGISHEAKMLGNTALDAALNAQFLVQIGVFTAVPMIMGFILESGLLQVCLFFDISC